MTEPKKLFLAWQDPVGRSWYPVALLGFDEDEGYSFQYVEGAREARETNRFPGIAQFPEFEVRYTASEIFPFLKNRVMARSRGDFERYAARLGVEDREIAHSLHAFDLLRRSNGLRATDRFEIFAAPERTADRARFVFFTRGVRYLSSEVREVWASRSPEAPLRLLCEPDNEFDPFAVLLTSKDLSPIGFAPRYYAEAIYSLLVDRSSARAQVVHHNPTPAPSRERFLVELDIAVPEGWQFASSDRFELIRPIEHAAAE